MTEKVGALTKALQAVFKQYNGYIILEKSDDPQDEFICVQIGSYDEPGSIDIKLEEIDEQSIRVFRAKELKNESR